MYAFAVAFINISERGINMATNPYVNKVQYGNNTLIDLTNDTATEETVLEGYTFHGADGKIRTGTAVAGGGDDKMDIDGTNADTSVTFPNSAFTVGSRSSSIDVGIVENYVQNVSTLPYGFFDGSVVVYNNKIHVLGGGSSTSDHKRHYSWDGTSWTQESTLPISFSYDAAVVYNNKIHIMYSTSHYSWNGTSWTQESSLPVDSSPKAVVYDNKIHALGCGSSSRAHYSFDGTSWTQESTLPISINGGQAVVYNNKIHTLGGNTTSTNTNHYSFDGTSWTQESTLPYTFTRGSAVVYDGKIHIMGSSNSSNGYRHSYWDGIKWFDGSNGPYNFYQGSAVVYDDNIHMLGGASSTTSHSRYESHADTIEIAEPEKPGTFVQGDQSMAAGDYSYARGHNCLAEGNYSKAEGVDAYAFLDFQHVSKGSSNKFEMYEFAAGRSLYNNVVRSSLTAETAIDGRYGCSGTVMASSLYTYIKIDPQGVYLLFIAENNGTSSAKNSVHLISYRKITYFNQDGSTSRVHTVQYINNTPSYDTIYFNISCTKLQFTLIRLI